MEFQPTSRFSPRRQLGTINLFSEEKILNITVKEQQLGEEGLHTLLCEAEAVINSRPITSTSSDLNDLEALTPIHLLLIKVKPKLPAGVFHKEDQ